MEEELDDDVMGAATGRRRDPRGGLERQSRARRGGATGGGVRPGDHDVGQGRRRECARGRAGAVAHVLTEDARAEEARERKERTVIRADTM